MVRSDLPSHRRNPLRVPRPPLGVVIVDEVAPTQSEETDSMENGEIGAFDGFESDASQPSWLVKDLKGAMESVKNSVAAKFCNAGDVDGAEGAPQQSRLRRGMVVVKNRLASLCAYVAAIPLDEWLSGTAFMCVGAPLSLIASKGVDWMFGIGLEDVDAKVGHTYKLAFEFRIVVLLLFGFSFILKYTFQEAGWPKGYAFMRPIVIFFAGCAAYNLNLVVYTYLTLAGEHYYSHLTN